MRRWRISGRTGHDVVQGVPSGILLRSCYVLPGGLSAGVLLSSGNRRPGRVSVPVRKVWQPDQRRSRPPHVRCVPLGATALAQVSLLRMLCALKDTIAAEVLQSPIRRTESRGTNARLATFAPSVRMPRIRVRWVPTPALLSTPTPPTAFPARPASSAHCQASRRRAPVIATPAPSVSPVLR